jgi:hypothetical protein
MKAVICLLSVVVAFPVSTASAWHGDGVVGHETWCAWKRTWHAQNSLDGPLRGYYIPRPPHCSDFGSWNSCCGQPAGYGGPSVEYSEAAPSAVVAQEFVGFEPVHFERLGQVPNELDIMGPDPATSAQPAASR